MLKNDIVISAHDDYITWIGKNLFRYRREIDWLID